MTASRGSVQLTLTPEQQEEIRKATGKLMPTLELNIEELEARIAPVLNGGRDSVSGGAFLDGHSPRRSGGLLEHIGRHVTERRGSVQLTLTPEQQEEDPHRDGEADGHAGTAYRGPGGADRARL